MGVSASRQINLVLSMHKNEKIIFNFRLGVENKLLVQPQINSGNITYLNSLVIIVRFVDETVFIVTLHDVLLYQIASN